MLQEVVERKGRLMLMRGGRRNITERMLSMAAELQAISPVIFIDSSNIFDKHFLDRMYPNHDQIQVSRAWSGDQLKSLVRQLDAPIKNGKSRVLLISPMDDVISSMSKEERERTAKQVAQKLSYLTHLYGLVTVVGVIGETMLDAVAPYATDAGSA